MPAAPVRDVLSRLQKVRKLASGGWIARCPGHPDREPSLSIAEGTDGRVLLTCHAGCEAPQIVAALGLTMTSLFPPREATLPYTPPPAMRRTAAQAQPAPEPEPEDDRASWRAVATYDYTDADGALVFQVVRKEPPVQLAGGKRKKTFVQRRPDGAGGWTYGLGGLAERPLYRLPELLEDVALGRTVLLVEGEKDCDTARALGVAAAAHMGGAKGWRPEYAAPLAGADVVIVPDHDTPGREWAAAAGAGLCAAGATVRMLALPVTTEGADLTEWVDAGGTRTQLDRLVARAIPWAPGDPVPLPAAPSRFTVLTLDQLESLPPLDWLVGEEMAGLFPAAALLAIYGAPGAGKSFIAADLACTLASRGERTWFGNTVRRGPVLYVAAEGGRGFRQRTIAWRTLHGVERADVELQFVLEPANLYGPDDVSHVLRACDQLPDAPALVVFDTLARCMVGGDENSAQDMGLVVDRADRVKRATGASVLLVHHSRKDGDTERGSIALRGAVDTLGSVREDEDTGGRVLACEKQKDAGAFDPIAFRLRVVGDSCAVAAPDPTDAADRLTPNGRKALETLVHTFPKGATATEWLRASGIADRTFYRVRAALVAQGYVSELDRGGHPRFTSTESGRWAYGTAR